MNLFSKIFLLILFSLPFSLLAQKHATAVRISSQPKIDGVLDEPFWKEISPAKDFTQFDPINGKTTGQKTEAFFAYNDDALFVGIMLYDTAPDSIFKGLSKRDEVDLSNADLVSVDLSPFSDGQNAMEFKVSAAGVQSDIKYSTNGEDRSWNPVWESAVKIQNNGWVAEFKIPFSAIRFPDKDKQQWSVNIWRHIRRTREWDTWNFIDQKIDGVFNQMGLLDGIENIKPPVRLSLTPYISAYLEHYPYQISGMSNWSRAINGGMDIKYGLNESFTLDMTLIPDFGQVQSDNKVLNLTPYETRYSENRPFFTEGTELFNKAGLFYSRRIGGIRTSSFEISQQADSNEVLVEFPEEAQLINATKISGRTNKKTGLGFFNAMSANTYATFRDTITGTEHKRLTQPFTNYNILVIDQAFAKNSYVSLINTNVYHDQGGNMANVTGSEFYLSNKKNTYALSGTGVMSNKFDKENSNPISGFKYNVSLSKVSGNLRYGASNSFMDHKFDINDIGYLASNNRISSSVFCAYNLYKPFWKYFLNAYNTLSVNYSSVYEPAHFTAFNLNFSSHFTLKNYLSIGLNSTYYPVDEYDFFEPRTQGRYYIRPQSAYFSGWFSSDYRKVLALDGNFGTASAKSGFRELWYGISPRFQPGTRTLFVYSINFDRYENDRGYVSSDSAIIFGNRSIHTIVNELNTTYIFSKNLSLSLRARHYWTSVMYNWFYTLNESGELIETAYNQNSNQNLNFFNVDLVFNWRFAPGSDFSFVWKNNVQQYQDKVNYDFFENFSNTVNAPQMNSFSVKVLYYIDYLKLKKKKENK